MKHHVYCRRVLTPNPQVGDVFPAKATGPRGRHYGTKYWVIVCVTDTTVHMIGLDWQGNVTSTTSCGIHVAQERQRLFRIKAVPEFLRHLRAGVPYDPPTGG